MEKSSGTNNNKTKNLASWYAARITVNKYVGNINNRNSEQSRTKAPIKAVIYDEDLKVSVAEEYPSEAAIIMKLERPIMKTKAKGVNHTSKELEKGEMAAEMAKVKNKMIKREFFVLDEDFGGRGNKRLSMAGLFSEDLNKVFRREVSSVGDFASAAETDWGREPRFKISPGLSRTLMVI